MKYKILAVDDEEDIIILLKYNLEKAGFNFVYAKDGPEAIELAKREKPNLILLDIMLPSMEGTEVCKILKSDESTSHIPVIMLTAKGEETDRVVGFELGTDDYVTKPFSPRELVLRIKAVLKRGGKDISGKVIVYGPFYIDCGRKTISVNGKQLDLTPTEFKLLSELIKAKGNVLDRDTLLDRVWGESISVIDRTVDTHIRRLRKKMGKYGSCIETVRGFGYRFKDESQI